MQLVIACAHVLLQVLKAAAALMAQPPASESDVQPLEKLIAEAYQEIDKAVVKGVLHQNTAARKKSRVARHKRMVLMAAGLFTPAESHPDYRRWQLMQKKPSSIKAPAAGIKA